MSKTNSDVRSEAFDRSERRWRTDLVVLSDAENDIVFQHVERVVHGVHGQVCGPLQTDLVRERQQLDSTSAPRHLSVS